MRKSAITLILLLACQSQMVGSAFAESALDKSLDKLLGTDPSQQDSSPCADSSSPAATPSTDGSADTKPAKTKPPKKEKERPPKKEKPPKDDSSSAIDAPKTDPSKIDKSLDKLLGTDSSKPDTSLPTPATDTTAPSFATDTTSPGTSSDSSVGSSSPDTSAGSPSDMSSSPSDDSSASAPTASDDSGASTGGSSGSDHDEYSYSDKQIKAGELNNQAVTELNNKQFMKAIVLLKQALAIDPTYIQGKNNLRVAYFNYAVEFWNNDRPKDALPWIEKAYALMKELHRDDADLKALYEDCKQAVKEQQAPAGKN